MVNDIKLQTIIGWTPHKNQATILEAAEKELCREVVIAAGRRFGKSSLCSYLALKTLLQDSKRVWIVAPTYDLTEKVFRQVVQWMGRVAPSQREGISYRPYPKIRTARGSTLECRSTENPTGLLGEEVDLEIVDEAARIPRNIFDTYLYPVTSSRKGRMISISTPFGKNWFYEQWVRANETGGAFRFSSLDGVSIDQAEWERARAMLPEAVFKQEYQALFLEDAASVFRGVSGIVAQNIKEDVKSERRYVMGVDLAKYNDFTVLTVMDTFTHKVVHWDRFREVSFPLQKGRITALAKRYNGAKVIIDSKGLGDPISEDLAREGVFVEDFKISAKSKQQLIEKLSLFIEQKSIQIPDEKVLVDELESYGYELTEHHNVRYGAPSGYHDDCVISLALAVWGLDSTKTLQKTQAYKKPKTAIHYQYR